MAPRMCEMCPAGSQAAAVVFCDADSCYLCAACDEDVHQANRLAQRHVRRPVNIDDMVSSGDEGDVLVPDVAEKTRAVQQNVVVPNVEPAAEPVYADFEEFEGMTFGKMPALVGVEADNHFMTLANGDALKAFDADDMWETVVPEEFEHVVPDIECLSPVTGVPELKDVGQVTMAPYDNDAIVPAVPVVPTSTRPTGSAVRASVVKSRNAFEASAMSSVAMAPVSSPSTTSGKTAASVFPSSPVSLSEVTQSSNECLTYDGDGKISPDLELKTAEERKQMRLEALARFRSKRANRSFQKKIRYGCRKVLAESRPRVKGRFVRKADMALYRRYGANYADYKGLPGALDGLDVDGVDLKPSC